MTILTKKSKNNHITLDYVCEKLLKFVVLPCIIVFLIVLLSPVVKESYKKRQALYHKNPKSTYVVYQENDEAFDAVKQMGEHVSLINDHDINHTQEIETYTINMAQSREEKIKAQFNPVNGAHYEIERYLKKHLQNANHYEHVSTYYTNDKSGINVITKYRINPEFGGTTTGVIKAHVNLNGDILYVWK